MRSITLTILFSCCLCGCIVSTLTAQTQPIDTTFNSALYQEKFLISPKDSLVHLRRQFILPTSESVRLDSITLLSGKEYTLDARFGVVRLYPELFQTVHPHDSLYNLTVSYQALPFSFKEKYRRRIPTVRLDTMSGTQITVSETAKSFSLDDLFGSNLQKSGSIVRGFTIGSNRDLSLNSGFKMQMAGNLAKDISIVAALTDENSPIQPEGTTRALQEVDKVFVEVRGKNMSATLGDFNLDISGSEFGRFSRKLQGAKGIASYQAGGVKGELMVTGAAPRGKFTTNQFKGLDGVQGPYRLVGQNNERDIIVIAGTERVYINGERMIRGDLYDYTIDYAIGEITFTSRRLISITSRITIDFEYTDRQYSRNLVAAQAGTSLLNDRLLFSATFLRESDDENSPIDLTLSEADKNILRLAGNDRFKATRAGVDSVGTGRGQYEARDTLVHLSTGQDSLLRIYHYNPIDTVKALYSVSFTDVGFAQGDYERVTLNQYRFVGVKKGSYAPIRFLPLPKALAVTDVTLTGNVANDVKLGGELAVSNFDQNRFSAILDNENVGSALKFALEYSPKNLRVAGKDFGELDLTLKERFVGKRYVAPDRINEVEFNRRWNINDTSRVEEEIHEGTLSYHPLQSLIVGGSAGSIRRGDTFSSDRYAGTMEVTDDNLPRTQYQVELIRSRDDRQGLAAQWTRHRGLTEYKFGKLTPRLGYDGEVLRNTGVSISQVGTQSFRFSEFTPGVTIDSLARMSLSAQYAFRWDDSLTGGVFQRAASSFTQTYGWRLSDWNAVSSALDVTVQKKIFAEAFRRTTSDDLDGILLRWQTQYNPADRGMESDFFYEVATGRSAKMERAFQRVPRGTGNYAYIGDVNNNHSPDEQDFQLTRFDGDFVAITVPTDQFIPVIDLKASTRIRLNGGRLFSNSPSWIGKALSTLSSETYVRVEEKSSETDKKQIYLLKFSRFLDDRTTINGSNLLTQDLFFLENNPAFSVRFRYNQRRGLTQFALNSERLYSREQSIRLQWQFVKEFANQTDLIQRRDILVANQFNTRAHEVLASFFITDWSYRPEQRIEFGFKFSFGQGTNFDSATADMNDQSARLLYSFTERGQARAELTREEVAFNKVGALIPFELTSGRVEGRSWLWKLGIDYRITQFIQGSINYDGRSEGGSHPVHTARAEVRAFF